MQFVTLSNGVKMPQLGYGVFQIDNAKCERCVSDAINCGYRLIDTAQGYGNEEGVGTAIAKSGIAREEFFVVDKMWPTNYGGERAAASIDASLKALDTDYIDLMILHQPFGDTYNAWRALEDAYKAGKLRAIGVSNFNPIELRDLAFFNEIAPMLNQIETHVFWQQKEARHNMDELGVQHMSWGPFAEGANNFFENPLLAEIGTKHGKSVGQIALRYLLDMGVVVIPKSSKKERMAENINVFDFQLNDEDRAAIAGLDTGKSVCFDHGNMNIVKWLFDYIQKEIDAEQQ